MAQPHRKGHQSKNKSVQRSIARKQRKATKLILAGIVGGSKNHKTKKKVKTAKPSQPYPCSAKQMALGD
jgi:hypothetical protein